MSFSLHGFQEEELGSTQREEQAPLFPDYCPDITGLTVDFEMEG